MYVVIATVNNLFHECPDYRYPIVEQKEILIVLIKKGIEQLKEQGDAKFVCFTGK